MKTNKKTQLLTIVMLVFFAGCAGWQRSCSSCNAENFGSDWIIVQYNAYGKPMNAWMLKGVSVTNEPSSDGIYWVDTATGHLVHISGWYNRVQVTNNNFEGAASLVGVNIKYIKNGKYEETN